MSLRFKAYVFLAVAAGLSYGGYWTHKNYELDGFALKAKAADGDKKKDKEPEGTPVEVAQAELGAISSYVSATANLRALREVSLKSQAAGLVREVLAEEGAFVNRGDLLCRLDDRELQINLDLARQRLAQTRVQLESSKILLDKNHSQVAAKQTEFERNEQALSEGLVSDTDVTLLRNQLAELRHDGEAQAATVRQNELRVDELASEIEKVEVQIANTRITAPFAGRIVTRTVELGQTIGAADELFKLATFAPLYADLYVSEQDSRRIRTGQTAVLALGAAGQETAQASILRVSPVVDDQTGTVKVTAELARPEGSFRPGAFVRVEIQTDTREQATLIPKRAVLEQDGMSVVFVNKDGLAERREIELGYADGAAVEVVSGIQPGESVVVAGQGSLKDGDKTRLIES